MKKKNMKNTKPSRLEPEDFYLNDAGLMVFTREYHLKRGYCCESGCLHCPWDFAKKRAARRAESE